MLFNAIAKYLLGLIIVCTLVFVPSGTLKYFGGWLFVGLLFIPMLILGTVMFVKSPELLKKRLDAKEQRSTQKGVVALSAIIFLGGFVIAGLDFRFGRSHVPMWCVIMASVILLVSYVAYAEVMRENAYLSRAIGVEQNQKVIDTGLYGVIRHPMYTSTLLMFVSIPIVLGSWLSLVCFAFYPIIIVIRIFDEEKLLKTELKGYVEYTKKVKYRLIPFIW